jgi:hypothetical protein
LAEHFKSRKYLKIFVFPWNILRGGKTPLNLLFFSFKFSNLEKLILGNLPGILKLKKIIFKKCLGGNILKLEKIRIFSFFFCVL